jgi:hypothetical protein
VPWTTIGIDWCSNSTCSTETTWTTWTSTATFVTVSSGTHWADGVWWQWSIEAPEQDAAREESARAYEAEVDRRLAAQEAARERARQLLHEHLTQAQQRQLQGQRYFTVIAPGSQRVYRIREGIAGNVRRVERVGRRYVEVEQLCVHPDGVPVEDVMLAQKLWIEHDEAVFRRTANITPLRRSA